MLTRGFSFPTQSQGQDLLAYHSYDTFASSNLIGTVRALPFVETACCATEEEFIINFHDLVGPELVRVKDICSKEFGGDASSKVLDGFTTKPLVIGHSM